MSVFLRQHGPQSVPHICTRRTVCTLLRVYIPPAGETALHRHTGGTRLPHMCHTDVLHEHTDTDNSGTDFSNTGIIWTCERDLRNLSRCVVDFDVMNPAYKVDLEGMTFEDAHCTLNRVNGFCSLSVRCNMDDKYTFIQSSSSLKANRPCSSIVCAPPKASLTRPDNSGTGKNRAQQQLITSIQHMTWQNGMPRMGPAETIGGCGRSNIGSLTPVLVDSQEFEVERIVDSRYISLFPQPKKHVRIISTDRCSSHLLWTSLNCGTCRCEECLTDAEYATRYQRGDIIGEKEGESIRCYFTRQNVEAVAQQNAHCLLELGLSCLSALIRVGIYPIILHIPLNEKSIKKLKKRPHPANPLCTGWYKIYGQLMQLLF
ncbi:unnamed protein product [Ranitomeya imitator]|uniref:Uncharacterized protein n=1 Tax=Ranitomeya imitator TaxID=111125 RepID=A0ABN9LRP2_9NEOB|nr:unnamed protein product [Ranitomeya imitator]